MLVFLKLRMKYTKVYFKKQILDVFRFVSNNIRQNGTCSSADSFPAYIQNAENSEILRFLYSKFIVKKQRRKKYIFFLLGGYFYV